MKIFVIFTGGTIGSSKNDGWINTDPNTSHRLINDYRSKCGNDVEFVTTTPYMVLSENLSAKELTLLVGSICNGIKGDFDGVIVVHGTDALQYSAAAAAFCVGCDCIPVMFVSSNYPLESDLANGQVNFEAAVQFITAHAGRGVYACYANELNGAADIHLATRMLRHAELSDKIESYNNAPYAIYRDGKIERCPQFVPSAVGTPCGIVHFCDDPGLLTVLVSPTEQYNFDLARYRAVMLLPYHSGTLNTANQRLGQFCQTAKERGVPVFLPDIPHDSTYDSMRAYKQLEIVALPGIASISLNIKIWIAASLGADLKEFVITPIAQEFVN